MKPANVLRIYELIMIKYDKLLPIYLNDVEDNNLDDLKLKLKSLTDSINSAATCVAGEDEVVAFGELKIWNILLDASSAAFNIATEKMRSEGDCEEYKKGFRIAYDAALRVELYRQFFAMGQNLNDLKLQFLKELKIPAPNLKSLIDFLFENISKNINSEFGKFQKAQSSMIETESQQVTILKSELDKLLKKFKQEFSNINTDLLNQNMEIQNVSLDFQIAAGQLIRSFQLKNESNESWAPFLKNMLLVITGIGAIVTAISLITKAATGHYLFFDKPIVRNTTLEEMAPEDKLLGTVYPAT